MKSQRRHELQQNVLDQELGKGIAWLRRHGSRVAWITLSIVLVAVIALYARRQQQNRLADIRTQMDVLSGWVDASFEVQTQQLTELSAQTRDKTVAARANLWLGHRYMQQYLQNLSAAPEQAKDYITKAEAYYKTVIDSYSSQTLLVAHARFGIAKIAETTGDLEKAQQNYQAILQTSGLQGQPVVIVAEQAKARLSAYAEPVRLATTAPATQPQDEDDDKTPADSDNAPGDATPAEATDVEPVNPQEPAPGDAEAAPAAAAAAADEAQADTQPAAADTPQDSQEQPDAAKTE